MAKDLKNLSTFLNHYQEAVKAEKRAREGLEFAIRRQGQYRAFIVDLIGEQAANHLLGEELNVQA